MNRKCLYHKSIFVDENTYHDMDTSIAYMKQAQNMPELYHKENTSIESFDYLNFGATPLVEYRDPYNCLNYTNNRYSPDQVEHLLDDYDTEPTASNQCVKQSIGSGTVLQNILA